jgi:chromosome segregation ATPase
MEWQSCVTSERSVEREEEVQRKESELESALEQLSQASRDHKDFVESEARQRRELEDKLAKCREESAELRAAMKVVEEQHERERDRLTAGAATAAENLSSTRQQVAELENELSRERRDRAFQLEELEKRKRGAPTADRVSAARHGGAALLTTPSVQHSAKLN